MLYVKPRTLDYNEAGNFYIVRGKAVGLELGRKFDTEIAKFNPSHTIYSADTFEPSTEEEFNEAFARAEEFYHSIVNAITERMYLFKFAEGEGMTYEQLSKSVVARKQQGYLDPFYLYYAPTSECFRIVKVMVDTAVIEGDSLASFQVHEYQMTISGKKSSDKNAPFEVFRFKSRDLTQWPNAAKGEQLIYISPWHYGQIREIITDYFVEI